MSADDAQGPKRGLLDRLADSIGTGVGAVSVFGTPVERDGLTVIPVAGSRFAFGGGGGPTPTGMGEGGGGSGRSRPLGFIELRGGHARFRRIADPIEIGIAALLVATGAAILAHALGRLAGACRRAGEPGEPS
ncbi:MAG TPA: hypothetical protein PKD63_12465 [Solirubrobacteraceae bacterium]|nr:hypothetical protein [Solirubrobacteraceae bacterium]